MLGTNQVLNQGRYRIIGSNGQNGSGVTEYEAYDTVSSANVVLRESLGIVGKVASANQLQVVNSAFAREAEALAAIRHESISGIQGHFCEIDRQYLVFEAANESLARFLDPAEGRPEICQVLSWMEHILSGLDHLHRLSPPIIHGNVRPVNFKLTSDGKARLLLAPVSAASKQVNEMPSDRAYQPLEQLWPNIESETQQQVLAAYDEKAAAVLLRPLDPRSDIYSTAASFYHILTGVLPPDAFERSKALLAGKPDPLARPSDLDPRIPSEISDALTRAMSIRREDRFDLPVIMAQVLRTAVIRAKERESILLEIPNPPKKEKQKDPMRDAIQSDFDPTSPEAKLELRQQLYEDRQRELEAEQARLEEEGQKIEARRLELEAEKERHAAERERLRQEAAEAREKAERERKRLEKERLEQQVEEERRKVAEKLAALEAEAERERAEQQRIEKEAEAERRRAEMRLQELKAEQELRRAEQERVKEQARKELEEAERRLQELAAAQSSVSEVKNKPSVQAATVPAAAPKAITPDVTDEIAVPDFGGAAERPARNWRAAAVGAAALLVVGGVAAWMAIPAGEGAPAATAITQSPATVPQTRPLDPGSSSTVEPLTQAASSTTAETTSAEREKAPSQEQTGSAVSDAPPGSQKHAQISSLPKKQPVEKTASKKKVTVDDLINDN